MPNTDNAEMPQDFPKRIHQALRSWYKQEAENGLTELLLAQEIKKQQENAPPRLISNQILMSGLDRLRTLDTEAVDIIERRFHNTETAREIAYSYNVTADVIYQRQRAAIEQLAHVIWTQELALRDEQVQRISARLEAPTYTRLFGVEENLEVLRERLTHNEEPWILAVEGMGGIGKTSLADALARRLAHEIHFRNIAWITVRQRLFRLTGDVKTASKRPNLTPAGLVDRLLDQFALKSLQRHPPKEKLAGLRSYLKENRALIVIDNLETITDYHALIPRLRELTNPSKFLITTRYSLQGESGVYIYPLKPLSQEATAALIRYEARNQGLLELAQAPEDVLATLYRVTGGNPLAVKLIVGKLHTFSLPVVLERLTEAQGKSVQKLLDFLHAEAWRSLRSDAQRLMQALLLMPESGGTLEQLAAATDSTTSDAAAHLKTLTQRSLVNVQGGLQEKRYALHQLTRTFVERIVTQEGL